MYGKDRPHKVYFFDIDGTVTNETEGWDYKNRTPRLDVIEKIRELHSVATIVFWTARHSIDKEVTVEWLRDYNIPYHDLIMDKPFWDEYICDKSYNVEEWINAKTTQRDTS